MPNMKWSDLNHLQLGQYGEYYAKMEFTSYKYYVYTSEVDDHGVDFVAKNMKTGKLFEVHVKSMLKGKYAFIKKNKICLDEYHLVCLLHFKDDELPEVYIIPATVWKNPNSAFVDRNYDKDHQKTKPEWGINYSQKNLKILKEYKAEKFFKRYD